MLRASLSPPHLFVIRLIGSLTAGSQTGFEVSPYQRPCTKGLWIYSTPILMPTSGPDGRRYHLVGVMARIVPSAEQSCQLIAGADGLRGNRCLRSGEPRLINPKRLNRLPSDALLSCTRVSSTAHRSFPWRSCCPACLFTTRWVVSEDAVHLVLVTFLHSADCCRH